MRADLAFGTAEAMATNQVIDWQRKEGGGEGGIVRGCAANPPLRSGPPRLGRGVQNRCAILSNPGGFVHTPRTPKNRKGPQSRPFSIFGGEGGIRTHVPELPDHPISSRRRYDHFGTSPVNLKLYRIYLSFYGVNLSNIAL